MPLLGTGVLGAFLLTMHATKTRFLAGDIDALDGLMLLKLRHEQITDCRERPAGAEAKLAQLRPCQREQGPGRASLECVP